MSTDTGNNQKAGPASPLGEGGGGGSTGVEEPTVLSQGRRSRWGRGHLPGSERRWGAGQGRSPQAGSVPLIWVTQPGLGARDAFVFGRVLRSQEGS